MKVIRNTCYFLLLFSVSLRLLAENSVNMGVHDNIIIEKFAQIPPLPGYPQQPGLAGVFSGIIDGNLIIAGGANFPDDMPWNGGEKKWWNDIYIMSTADREDNWQVFPEAFPRKLAYGVSINLPEGILCIGGNNSKQTYDNVFLIKYIEGGFVFEKWPALPVPLSNMTGALVDNKIYIAGGIESVSDPIATDHFFVLDLADTLNGWKRLESWPGPPRAFSVSAVQSDGFDNCFYLFSGRNFGPDRPLQVLDDGYEYNTRLNQWKQIDKPDGPQFPVMAGSAIPSGANHIIFFGGVDEMLPMKEYDVKQKIEKHKKDRTYVDSIKFWRQEIVSLLDTHPGFRREISVYHTITNTIYTKKTTDFHIPVTTNLVKSDDQYFITSGEIMPGKRTPNIYSVRISRTAKSFGTLNIIVIFIYFGILVLMGLFFSKRQKTSNDYFKAGGRIPWWAVGLSIFGTALSAITFMAIPAKAYATDWSYILMNAGIVLVAPLIVLVFIPFYRKLNITTAYEYLEKRFNLTTRLICSISFILFQIGRMGVVLLLPAIALNVVTGINIFFCIGLMGVLSLIYTMMGGIEAVVWTDAMQVIVLLGGAIFAVIYIALDTDGGIGAIISQGVNEHKYAMASVSWDLKNPTLWTVLLATVFANITTYGTDQTMVQRYLTTSSRKMASRSVWMNVGLTIPATLIFFFVGTALWVFFKSQPELLSVTVAEGDAIFPWYIFTQLPPGGAGLLISGVFAAAMSTLSSSMNSAATAYSVDIHFRFGWTEKYDQLFLARIFTLILGLTGILFALLMATWDIKSLWDEFQKILGLVLGGLGGLFLLGLLTKRATGEGAVIGLVASVLVQFIVMRTQPVHLLLYAGTGFMACFIVGYLSSLFFPANNNDLLFMTESGQNEKIEN
jgi:solute:Na+ symporter, SSS family